MAEESGSRAVGNQAETAADEIQVKIVNLHALGSGCTTAYESQAGAFGTPECIPPAGRRDCMCLAAGLLHNCSEAHILFKE